MTIAGLGEICAANGLALSDEQLEQLGKYAGLLRGKNQVVNLISRKDEENIISKHILHSLTLLFPSLLLAGIPQGAKVFDLGTGGGLPGIPVKIARPDLSVILCDSIAKKINAANEMIASLELRNISAITSRAEDLAKKTLYRNKFDVVITRAVAPLEDLANWSRPLIKKGGSILALKGGDLEAEIKNASRINFVRSIEEEPLILTGYDEFVKEEKKIIRVMMI